MWSTTTRTRVSDAIAVTLFVKCFNPLYVVWMEREFDAYKLTRCMCPSTYNRLWDRARNICQEHLQKVGCFIHFIYSRAFNNNVISNGKSYCSSNDTFTDVRLTSLLAIRGLHEMAMSVCLFVCLSPQTRGHQGHYTCFLRRENHHLSPWNLC